MSRIILTLFAILLVLDRFHSQDSNDTQPIANTTVVPSNQTDIANATEPTTEEPMTTTSPNVDPPEDHAFRHFIHYKEDQCVCDLRKDWCDIDCCCDNDCDEFDKSSFGRCIPIRKQVYDSRYCNNKNIVYINNTQTKLEVTSNGLFCIVWDNTGRRLLFDDPKPIADVNRLLNITAQHNHKWSLKNIRGDAKSSESFISRQKLRMISGRSVWISKESNETRVESQWELPSAGVTRLANCNTFRKVKYLIDFESSCYRFVPNLSRNTCETYELLNANHSKSMRFVSKTDTDINITSEYDLTNRPQYDPNKRICRNVVQSVHYTLWHNGSEGILGANVSFETIELKDNTNSFKQTFKVSFRWDNKPSGLELSGNPGYIVEKPIVAAFYTKDMNLSRSATGYHMLSESNGLCDDIIKKPIEFGINWRSGCLLKFGKTKVDSCESIQRNIWRVLEPEIAIDMIGMFGSSSVDKPTDWIKLMKVDNTSIDPLGDDKCPVLVTGVSLYLYYVMAGTAVQPQHKIVGAVKKFRSQSNVRVKCLVYSFECEDLFVELSTSVTFVDITRPARPEWARPVTFKIQLPSDFFYPFLASDAHRSETNSIILNLPLLAAIPFLIKTIFCI